MVSLKRAADILIADVDALLAAIKKRGLFRFEDTELIQVVTNDVASVGSGSKLALAAMDTS